MNVLLAVIGIVMGGMMFHYVGAVSGGILGWLPADRNVVAIGQGNGIRRCTEKTGRI